MTVHNNLIELYAHFEVGHVVKVGHLDRKYDYLLSKVASRPLSNIQN